MNLCFGFHAQWDVTYRKSVLLAEHLELRLAFLLNSLDTGLYQGWRSRYLSNIEDLAHDGYQILQKLQRGKQCWHGNAAECLGRDVQGCLFGCGDGRLFGCIRGHLAKVPCIRGRFEPFTTKALKPAVAVLVLLLDVVVGVFDDLCLAILASANA